MTTRAASQVRLTDQFWQVRDATLAEEVPQVTDRLPSIALATEGGGEVALDPTDRSGAKALEKLFLLDIRTGPATAAAGIGERAYVRFDHGTEPIAEQIYRRVRQLLLKRFNV